MTWPEVVNHGIEGIGALIMLGIFWCILSGTGLDDIIAAWRSRGK